MGEETPEPGRRSPPEETPDRRRFHLIGVGLPKTGTTSLGAVFSRYRWGHEVDFERAIDVLHARLVGTATDADVGAAWGARDQHHQLECDSASFHHYAAPLLVDLFPDARFVWTLREPVDQIGSFLDMMVRNCARHGGTMPAWQVRIGELMIGAFEPSAYSSPERLQAALPDLTDRYLTHWATATERLLDCLPSERTLVLETEGLSQDLPRLAAWAGVPVETLTPAHENRAPARRGWLAGVPGLDDRVAHHCGATRTRVQAWLSGRAGPGPSR